MNSRLVVTLFIIVMLFAFAGLLMHGVAQFLGLVSNREFMPLFLVFGAGGVALSAFMLWESIKQPISPQEKAEILLRGWQTALAQGDYARAQTIVEAAMQRLPISSTRIPGIITSLHQGQFDRVQALAQQVIHDHSAAKGKIDQDLARPILSQVHCLLADMAMFQRDFDTAATHLEEADGYKPQDAQSFYIMAKFSLYQSDLERANLDLRAAQIRTRKLGQDLPGLHLALQAWSTAQRQDHYNASTLIQTALKKTPSGDRARRAEIHLIQGYVERILSHPDEARTAFQAAVSYDPQGIYGLQARTELENAPA